jgi:hypothetical protein
MNSKVKLSLNILATGLTAGFWAPIWLGIYVYQKWHAGEVIKYQRSELIKKTQFEINEIKESLFHHKALDQSLEKIDSVLPNVGVIVACTNLEWELQSLVLLELCKLRLKQALLVSEPN